MKHSLIACLMIALPTLALAGPGEPGHSHAHSHDHAHSHASGDTPFGKPGNPKMKAQTIDLRMVERDGAMAFEPNEIKLKKGEQVRFRLANAGLLDHEIVSGTLEMNLKHAEEMKKNPDMEHDDPNGKRLAPGKTGDILWRFTKAGTFDFSCLIPGHREAGMSGKIIVK